MMKPALTAEEWARTFAAWRDNPSEQDLLDEPRVALTAWTLMHRKLPHEAHALAALCLHGQPFGFTREHVAAVLLAAGREVGSLERDLEDVAELIEALLPPEKYDAD